MRRLVILNPASKQGRARLHFNRIYGRLREALGDFELYLTESPGDCTARVADALRNREFYQILVAGGDGTINEAVNGYFEKGKLITNKIPLGVINLGTGGDFFRTLRDSSPGYSIAIQENTYRMVDIGTVTLNDDHHPRYFINIASTGMSGEVISSLKNSSFQKGTPAFFYHTLKVLIGYRPVAVRINLLSPGEGWIELEENPINLFVCNGRYNGAGMNWAPRGNIEDGVFDLVVVSGVGKFRMLLEAGRVYSGRISEMTGVHEYLASEIVLTLTSPTSLELDGELPQINLDSVHRIHFRMMHKAFPLIV